MTPVQRQHRYGTVNSTQAENQAWGRLVGLVQTRVGRHEVRSGHTRFTSSEIVTELNLAQNEQAVVEGATRAKELNPISVGRWLKDRLVDAPINGLVLRSATDRKKVANFWIEAM
jgi:hypothetical protein